MCLNNQYEPYVTITKDCIECLTFNFGSDCSIETLIEIRDSGIFKVKTGIYMGVH